MNFIVASLLVHCSEDVAFWLFVSLIEDYDLRDIFQASLPGLYKHSQVLQLLQMEHLGSIYRHFCTHHIQVEMYASDWIFALFSNIIPLSEYQHFLDCFFQGGWSFFYKFSLSFLHSLQEPILETDDISEILSVIKLKNLKRNQHGSGSKSRTRENAVYDSVNKDTETSILSSGENGGLLKSSVKSYFTKYMGEAKIDGASFHDDAVWERLAKLSLRQWNLEFNEAYVQQLLQSFDPKSLVFQADPNHSPKQFLSPFQDSQAKQVKAQTQCKKSSSSQSFNLRSMRNLEMEGQAYHTMGNPQGIRMNILPYQSYVMQQEYRQSNIHFKGGSSFELRS
jgi:hypothetical protein